MLSQLVNGMQVELLFEQGRWCFVRQMDGYLGWMYRPCLTGAPSLPATHFLAAPVEALFARSGSGSPIATRVLGGTALAVLNVINTQAKIELTGGLRGWLPEASLRPLAQIPSTSALRREQIIRDAAAWTGTPYLWGGNSANGIDCSGLAQLAHRLAGLTIPRDADMQCAAGRKVEAPYRAGDLLFFGEHGEKRRVTHVAISLGGWQIIHSSRSNNGVYCDDVQAVPHLNESFLEAVTFLDD
jgi:cell wall-associated NlpC family hydrolase